MAIHTSSKPMLIATLVIILCIWTLYDPAGSRGRPENVDISTSSLDSLIASLNQESRPEGPVNDDGLDINSPVKLDIFVPPPFAAPVGADYWEDRKDESDATDKARTRPNATAAPDFRSAQLEKLEHRALISYAYSESDFSRPNLKFFVTHGVHGNADFVFILNGETDVEEAIIRPAIKEMDQKLAVAGRAPIKFQVIHRSNTCFDLGAHAEVLSKEGGGEGWGIPGIGIPPPGVVVKDEDSSSSSDSGKHPLRSRLMDNYKRFILMNASVRGPFMPYWSSQCWSNAFLDRLTSKVKLVGTTYNCLSHMGPGHGHVQSMVWALDNIGLHELIRPHLIAQCFSAIENAMGVEVAATPHLRSKGYHIDALMMAYHMTDKKFDLFPKNRPLDTYVKAAQKKKTSHGDLDPSVGHPESETSDPESSPKDGSARAVRKRQAEDPDALMTKAILLFSEENLGEVYPEAQLRQMTHDQLVALYEKVRGPLSPAPVPVEEPESPEHPSNAEEAIDTDGESEEDSSSDSPDEDPNQDSETGEEGADDEDLDEDLEDDIVAPLPLPEEPEDIWKDPHHAFWEYCEYFLDDVHEQGWYFGFTVHPYELIFIKTHRHIDANLISRVTDWHDGSGYSSLDVCT